MSHHAAPWPRRPAPVARLTAHRTPTGKVRWIATLAPEADVAYARAVAGVLPAVERRLGPEVLADRARPSAGPVIRLAPWGAARRRWREVGERRMSDEVRGVLVTDVRDCYASITAGMATEALRGAGAPSPVVEPVIACLRAFEDEGLTGLPVGPAASAVLANAILAVLDDALRSSGVRHLRWVDDVVAFTPSVRDARCSLDTLRRAAAGLGLELHDAKTRILDDPEEARSLIGIPNSRGAATGVA